MDRQEYERLTKLTSIFKKNLEKIKEVGVVKQVYLKPVNYNKELSVAVYRGGAGQSITIPNILIPELEVFLDSVTQFYVEANNALVVGDSDVG